MATICEALTIAMQHHQSGRLEAAEQIYRQILEVDPKQADAIHLLGMIAYQRGEHEIAAASISRAIELNGNAADFHYNLGNVYTALHRTQDAIACYRRALALKPVFAGALNNLGPALKEQGKLDEAIACYRRALELQPNLAEAHCNLGVALKEQGKLNEATACLREALELNPRSADAHNNLGITLLERGRPAEAAACFRQALEILPHFAEAHHNLGNALAERHRLTEAVESYQRALALDPSLAAAHNNLGNAFKARRQPEEAEACYRRALELQPSFAEAHINLGAALDDQGKLGEALTCFRRALELKPDHAGAHNNLGNAFKALGELDEAAARYRRALELKPDFPEAHTNLGICLLLSGCYEAGWPEYEYRLEHTPAPRKLSAPRWRGERAEGETLLIYSEQGFGDTIHFARYALLVRQRTGAARVVMEIHPLLERLFAYSGGFDVEIAPSQSGDAAAFGELDRQAPLLSLPIALGLFEPLPMTTAYLRADPELRRAWRERIALSGACRVGLVWAGNPENDRDHLRSLRAESFRPVLAEPGFQFYSLQVGPQGRQARPLEGADLIDLTSHIVDFADTAALVAELDLVITVDTAIAHLAGAMAKPVWTMLPFVPDWRWRMDGDATPWYPTMRLFRQPTLGDWDAVIKRIAAELRLLRSMAGNHPP